MPNISIIFPIDPKAPVCLQLKGSIINSSRNIKSQYKSYKRRQVSLLGRVARMHGVSKSHVCNVIAGRKKNDLILRSVKKLISKSNAT